MKMCLKLARQALANGDSPVGSIIVHKGDVIGWGIESGKSSGDVTNHAEILAVRDAINRGHQNLLSQSKMYTTHEPCIMCSYLIRHHQIPHIIYGVSVDFVGGFTSKLAVLKTENVPKWGKGPKVTEGVCEAECRALSN